MENLNYPTVHRELALPVFRIIGRPLAIAGRLDTATGRETHDTRYPENTVTIFEKPAHDGGGVSSATEYHIARSGATLRVYRTTVRSEDGTSVEIKCTVQPIGVDTFVHEVGGLDVVVRALKSQITKSRASAQRKVHSLAEAEGFADSLIAS